MPENNLRLKVRPAVSERQTRPVSDAPVPSREVALSPERLPLPADDGVLTAADRRVRVRYYHDLKTFCQRGPGELDQVWWMGTVKDISAQGIALLLQHRFEPGTLLTLEVENPDHTFSQTCQVKVIRISPQPACWLLGCVFTEELTEVQIQALIGAESSAG